MKQKNYLNFNKNINYHLNIILINDVKMKKLNLKFKQTNKTTDVLTFVSTIEDIFATLSNATKPILSEKPQRH